MSTQLAHTILNHLKTILIFLAIGFAGFMLLDLVYFKIDGGWKLYFIPLICGYFYLLIDKRTDKDVYAECPNCQKRINLSVKWACPKCGNVHKEKTLITLPCYFCGTVNNDIYCGWCKKEIKI
jgi:predicted RNA-binding Zn-ribbon protein involved in translation (DUF1610 family)